MNNIDIFINIILACKYFSLINIFFDSEKKPSQNQPILPDLFVNKSTRVRLKNL